jgi:transposase-like protein
MVFDNYQRSEAALITTMAEMVIAGVSTRKVSGVMETLCGMEISKSSVSQACKELDEHVKEYRERALEDKYPFLIVDATYFSVRENYRVQSKALMIAIGITMGGKKEVLGFSLYDRESKETWLDFLQSLRNRGIQTVKLITSDAHEGIIHAINHVYPDTPWQRCQFHFTRNIADAAPKKVQQGLLIDLNAMFNCRTLAAAEKCRDAILQNYSDCAEKSMQCLMDGFYDAMSVMYFPKGLRKVLRTSNHIERLNGELKRRSQVIQIFPNQDSVIRTMGSVLMEISSKWSTMNRMFYAPAIAGISDPGNQMKIVELARRQRDLHKAA